MNNKSVLDTDTRAETADFTNVAAFAYGEDTATKANSKFCEPTSKAGPPSGTGKDCPVITILAVDDDVNDLFLLKRALAASAVRHQLAVASDGAEAQQWLQSLEPRAGGTFPGVILCDLNMPRLNGLELLEWLKNEPQLRGIPVAMMSTAFQNPINADRAFALGAIACMSKPTDRKALDELLKTISAGVTANS